MSKEMWYLVAFIGFLLLLFLPKNKVCQNSATGDLKSRPWFWPCGSGSDRVTSASTD